MNKQTLIIPMIILGIQDDKTKKIYLFNENLQVIQEIHLNQTIEIEKAYVYPFTCAVSPDIMQRITPNPKLIYIISEVEWNQKSHPKNILMLEFKKYIEHCNITPKEITYQPGYEYFCHNIGYMPNASNMIFSNIMYLDSPTRPMTRFEYKKAIINNIFLNNQYLKYQCPTIIFNDTNIEHFNAFITNVPINTIYSELQITSQANVIYMVNILNQHMKPIGNKLKMDLLLKSQQAFATILLMSDYYTDTIINIINQTYPKHKDDIMQKIQIAKQTNPHNKKLQTYQIPIQN